MGGGAPRPRRDPGIAELCKVRQGVLPRLCYSLPTRYLAPGKDLLTDPPNGVDEVMAERLMTALAASSLGDNALVSAVTRPVTLSAFRAMNGVQQLALVNALWRALTTAHAFSTVTNEMYEPAGDAPEGAQGPLPTSWCPTARGATTCHKRHREWPWRTFGVGFRVDGNGQGAIDRNTGNGFRQQRLSPDFMLGVRGQRIDGTVVMDASRALVWTGNHDIFNETAVCVSRNFFGATAFPERETVDDGDGYRLLWAINCLFLRGFDTEAHQLTLPNARQWRPGEKAYRQIPKERVIGYVKIQRRGAADRGGWSFHIPDAEQWTFTGGASDAQKRYMQAELDAWRGTHVIPPEYDFAT